MNFNNQLGFDKLAAPDFSLTTPLILNIFRASVFAFELMVTVLLNEPGLVVVVY